MYKYFLSILLIVNLTGWCYTFTIEPIELEIMDGKFRLSLPSDPDIKWVSFNVNINKEFKAFESGQLSGVSSIPRNKKWSIEFDRTLKDTDLIYVWLAVQHDRFIFRDRKDPISVEAFKSGNPYYIITTTTSKALTGTPSTTTESSICRPTVSEVPPTYGGPYCRDDLIFEDNFDVLNDQIWTNEVLFQLTVDDAVFVLYNGTLGVENGVLNIKASVNNKNIKKDDVDLGSRCTTVYAEQKCWLKPSRNLYLPPIISGRLSSNKFFNFKYGRVAVRAKMPKGDWLFPLISLQPNTPTYGEHYRSGEIRVAYIHGNKELNWGGKNINGGRLYGGAIVNHEPDARYQFLKDITLPNVDHFGDDFHLYELTWTPQQLIMAVDGQEYGRIKTNFKETINERAWTNGRDNAPLDQLFYITLGLAAGGHGDFPNTKGKPWENTDPKGVLNFESKSNIWLPSWTQPSLEVDYVRVYAV